MGHKSWHRFQQWYIEQLSIAHGKPILPIAEIAKIAKGINWDCEQLKILEAAYTAGFYDGIKCSKEYDPLWDAD